MSPLSGYTPLLQFGLKCHQHHQYYIIIIIIIINYNYYHHFFQFFSKYFIQFWRPKLDCWKDQFFFCNLFTHKALKSFYELVETWSNWNLKVLVFEDRGKPEFPGEKPLGAKERTNNKLNPHIRLATSWPLISSLREKRASTRSRCDEGITNQEMKNQTGKDFKGLLESLLTYGVDAGIGAPGTHWWEASALNTAPPMLSYI